MEVGVAVVGERDEFPVELRPCGCLGSLTSASHPRHTGCSFPASPSRLTRMFKRKRLT